MKIAIVTDKAPPQKCGVGDYSVQLGAQLSRMGHQVSIIVRMDDEARATNVDGVQIKAVIPNWGVAGTLRLVTEVKSGNYDLVMLQWVPFLYSRYGINLCLPLACFALRSVTKHLHVSVHELWMPLNSWIFWPQSLIQRFAMILLLVAAKTASFTVAIWANKTARWVFWNRSKIVWVPVGSNIPVYPLSVTSRSQKRLQLGIEKDDQAVAIFSPGGNGIHLSLLDAACKSLQEKGQNPHFVVLGSYSEGTASKLPHLQKGPRVHAPGYLEAEQVSHYLQLCDLCLAPTLGGMNARRGSAMAALAHGLNVVSNRGEHYSPQIFEGSPLYMSEESASDYAETVLLAYLDPDRKNRAQTARAFYDQVFSWPVIAQKFLGLVDSN